MYKVTIAMPVYNVAEYIERALLSALNQTFGSIEILLVDDKSSDNSIEIARNIIKSHPHGKNVRIIEHFTNIGTGAARNTAINNAKGEYLYFMDSDDEISLNCIEILYNVMIETPVDIVVASYRLIDENSITLNNNIIFENLYLDGNDKIVLSNLKSKIFPVMMCNKLYNISFLRDNDIKCIPHHITEDVFFSFSILQYVQKIRTLSNELYLYRKRENSLMGKKEKHYISRYVENIIEIFCAKYEIIKNCNTRTYYAELLINTYVSETIILYKRIFKNKSLTREEKNKYFPVFLKNKYIIFNRIDTISPKSLLCFSIRLCLSILNKIYSQFSLLKIIAKSK